MRAVSRNYSKSELLSKAFEISLRLRFVHFISLSIGLPAVWSFKILTKTSSIFSTVSMIFFLPPPGFRILFSGVSVPVSYTHLRAHETVLDLVCRLLLEKKKKKKE